MTNRQKHEFALYLETLPKQNTQDCAIKDADCVFRMTKVLRLSPGDTLSLFNQQQHIVFTLTSVTHGAAIGTTGQLVDNTVYEPVLTLLLPVLKRDALEAAVYGAVESGVSKIQLVTTQKVQRKWGGQKELERMRRIVIAAAEQSKCFAFADVLEPISFDQMLVDYAKEQFLFADPTGQVLQAIQGPSAVLVGPEGDLTDDEKAALKKAGATFFKLTPTVLRAQQAAILSVGLLRSI